MSLHPKTRKPCADCGKGFLGTAPARFCPDCRWRHRGQKPKKYLWTAERDQLLRARYNGRVKGRAAAVAALFSWPCWVIKKRAAQLGLCYSMDRRDWTERETAFLMEHAGHRHTHWIAKQLGRTETSVVLKFKRLRISRRFKEGYTMRELELCFGTDHHVIERWVREGKLISAKPGQPGDGGHAVGIRRRGTARARDPWMVSDTDLLRFITSWPLVFRLDKVDQLWFMDLVTSGGLLRKALADEVRLESA